MSSLTVALQSSSNENSCPVATVNKECHPNVAPKGALVRCNGKGELITEGQIDDEMAAHVAKRGLPP